jgi:hypothetical protein
LSIGGSLIEMVGNRDVWGNAQWPGIAFGSKLKVHHGAICGDDVGEQAVVDVSRLDVACESDDGPNRQELSRARCSLGAETVGGAAVVRYLRCIDANKANVFGHCSSSEHHGVAIDYFDDFGLGRWGPWLGR